MTSAIEILPGPRATERRLLELLSERVAEARADPTELARPVRVLVPSRSLRLHVAERIASELGAVAGITVQTLFGAAVEVLDRAGEEEGGADLLVELLARRLARDERPLAEAFEPFRDGYRTVSGTVRDLLDAGFEAGHEEAARERVGAARLARDEGLRAEAVVRTAARVAAALEARGRGGRAALLRLAREAFEEDPERALPARLVVVHGFADATGRASDLLEAFARRLPTHVLFDHPSDPDDPGRADLGCAFTERLVERLAGVLGRPDAAPRDGAATPPALFRAPGAAAEAREVARRIRALVEGGERPERIGVVARDLPGHVVALRRELGRLGVPSSALRARAPLDGAGRAVLALVELFEEGERVAADRWLDATRRLVVTRDGEDHLRGPSSALRLGLRVVGAVRLDETAELDPARHLDAKDALRLPVRKGVDSGKAREETDDGERRDRGFHAPQERLYGSELRGAVKAAGALRRRLARWPKKAPLARHLAELEKLRSKDLGWRAADRAEQRVRPALERLALGFGGEDLTADELAFLLRRVLVPVARPPYLPDAPAGGGGVRVLDAMEARALTFDHVFLIGLNRDEFPRVVREDPLLGEDARRALTDLLPDVPLPSRGRDEDRYLFAQLASSAPSVAISWQVSADDGKARVVSPLVERLLREKSADDVPAVPPVFPLRADEVRGGGPRTAHEHAVLGGLHGGAHDRTAHERRLALALAEAGSVRGADDAAALARTRTRVLAAHDEGFRDPEKLAPWLGFVGAQDAVDIRPDPLVEPLYVTRFEALARCPWQAVLTRLLRLEAMPDPLDSLPGLDPRTTGNVVHEVLQRLVERAVGRERRSFEEVLAREPVPMAWPDDDELEALLRDVAATTIARSRRPVPGLVRTVAEHARPALLRARDFDRGEAERFSDYGVLGTEVEGRATVELGPGIALDLLFRADRIERRGGKVALSDFKTGRPKSDKEIKTKDLPRGDGLQPLVYLLGAAAAGEPARGRFLFLKEDREGKVTEVEVAFDEHADAHRADLANALGTMLLAWRAGALFPRFTDDAGEKEPPACRTCDVSAACLRGDSGAKQALVGAAHGELPASDAATAFRALWALDSAKASGAPKAKKGKGAKR